MNKPRNRSFERPAFAALVALLLAPIVAHGLWRPLVHVFGSTGQAGAVTGGALAISLVCVIAQYLRPARMPLLSLALGALLAIGASFGLSLGLAGLLTLLGVAVAMALLVHWLQGQLPPVLDGLAGRHKLLTALYVLLALASVFSTARMSIFMGDPTRVDQQVMPGVDFLATHSCLSAYVNAATLVHRGTENIYDERWWAGSEGMAPLAPGAENPYRPFLLDYYAYPPPFLFAVAPLAFLEGDFAAQRALWFGFNGLLLALGLWVVARWIDGPNAHRALLLAPIFFGSLPILGTLQVGNFQIAVVMISVMAMVAFDKKRPALGGALLAFAIMSKISPGIFGIVLLVQRRWREAAWTAGFGVVLLVLSVPAFGLDPLKSFVTYALPRISSGQAFAFLDDRTFSILTNMSSFGLPFKLRLLGLEVGDPWVLAPRIGHVYTFVLVILAVVCSRRPGGRRSQGLAWMALLVLGALQSPFAPGYVSIGLLWATTLMAVEVRRLRGAVAIVLVWIVINVVPDMPVRYQTIQSIVQMVVIMGVPIWLLMRGMRWPVPSTIAPQGA